MQFSLLHYKHYSLYKLLHVSHKLAVVIVESLGHRQAVAGSEIVKDSKHYSQFVRFEHTLQLSKHL